MEKTRKLLEEARAKQAAAEERVEELAKTTSSLRSELGTVKGQLKVEHLAATTARTQ